MTNKSSRMIALVVINAIFLIAVVSLFVVFTVTTDEKLYQQSLGDLSNVNRSSASIAGVLYKNQKRTLANIANYTKSNQLSYEAFYRFMWQINSDQENAYQLVGRDCKGVQLSAHENEASIPVDYSSYSYTDDVMRIVLSAGNAPGNDIKYCSEFTDSVTTQKCIAIYTYIHLVKDGEKQPYTLMSLMKTASFNDMIKLPIDYPRSGIVIVNEKGDYIFSDRVFKSDNFFRFLKVYNDLTLEKENQIRDEVSASEGGVLYYRNSAEDCVFSYLKVAGTDWLCISCVPLSAMGKGSADLSYMLVLTVLLLTILLVDVLWLRRMNRALARSMERERVSNSAKTDFLSRMSHDMRTPMNGILGMTSITMDMPGLPNEAKSNLADIYDSSQYLLNLINDTLDMNKIESQKIELHKEPVLSSEMAAQVIKYVQHSAKEKRLTVDYVPINTQPVYINVDRARLQQVFTNLLSNSVKFTPENGAVQFIVETLKRDERFSYCRMTVKDNGVGMSESFLAHAFEPFSQEKNAESSRYAGTGLGLPIVKNLVELMGGTLSIKSQLGEGTEVIVDLTLERLDDYKPKAAVIQNAAAGLMGKRVLLCEDHPLNAKIAVTLLEKVGMRVDLASNGAEGLKRFEASEAAYYDAVLMDIRMPEMNGIEATKAIRGLARADASSVPIIAMTANAFMSDVEECLQAGMNAHLAKPIQPELMFSTLETWTSSKPVS